MPIDPRTPCIIGVARAHVASRRGRRRGRTRAARRCGSRSRAPRPTTAASARALLDALDAHRDRLLPDLAVRRPGRRGSPTGSAPTRSTATTRASAARRRSSSCTDRPSAILARRARPRAGRRRRGARDAAARTRSAASATRTRSSPTEKRPFPWEAPSDPVEVAHEVFQAWLTFAVFDNARRAHLGDRARRVPRRGSARCWRR